MGQLNFSFLDNWWINRLAVLMVDKEEYDGSSWTETNDINTARGG